MARTARVALPEDEYLVLIGQAAYMVSSLEWTILGDLPGLAQYRPTDLTTSALAGKSTGQIAGALSKAVDQISDDHVRAYVELAGEVLGEAAIMRNGVPHARPATIGGEQRLYRWKSGRAFAIDTAWLEGVIDKLSKASTALDRRGVYYGLADIALRRAGFGPQADRLESILDAVLRGPRLYDCQSSTRRSGYSGCWIPERRQTSPKGPPTPPELPARQNWMRISSARFPSTVVPTARPVRCETCAATSRTQPGT